MRPGLKKKTREQLRSVQIQKIYLTEIYRSLPMLAFMAQLKEKARGSL